MASCRYLRTESYPSIFWQNFSIYFERNSSFSSLALKQVQNEVPLKIVFQPQPAVNPSDLEPPNYTEIKEELTEFYDEFCAWSDIRYIDEPLLYQNVVSALETLIDKIVQ